ncbi:MAG TPA: rod shape-determining protein MreC [Solirubrobacteraceae bacterium]|nr:rod shape-determining protein MreC [Solirubrobacteraceae bacterium]
MYDKAVRRRRAVLVALVALSLILVTAYFGESTGGGLHAVQRGAMEALAPIQEGANRILKPFRDAFGWFGSTLDAKEQRDELKRERDALRAQVAQLEVQGVENRQLRGLLGINSAGGIKAYEPVLARVFARSPSTWYSTVEINKGTSDGVRADQPVVNGEGLVGKVKSVTSGSAVVMLLTDQDFGVSAKAARSGEPGSIDSAVGAPGELRLELVPRGKLVEEGERIVTAGTVSPRLKSLFPPGILIGTVNKVDEGEGELDRRIHVRPAADLRRLENVEVLTKPGTDLRASVGPGP